MTLNFCQVCGNLLSIEVGKLQCACCGMKKSYDSQQFRKKSDKTFIKQTVQIVIQKEQRPVIDEVCPHCGHDKAYFETRQMRSADEGQTVFFECCKCGYKSKQNT